MSTMNAMDGANIYWAMIACDDGIGYLGPENLLDNQAQKLAITIGTNVTVFGKTDVRRINLICATSEWVKYEIILKNNKHYIATFLVLSSTKQASDKNAPAEKGLYMGLLNFEWWMSGIIYKTSLSTARQSATTTAQTRTTSAPTTAEPPKRPVIRTTVRTEAPKRAATAVRPVPAPHQKPIEPAPVSVTTEPDIDTFEKEKLYGYALQMYGNRSYSIAYNVLSKIKGYKNADQLLLELEDKA